MANQIGYDNKLLKVMDPFWSAHKYLVISEFWRVFINKTSSWDTGTSTGLFVNGNQLMTSAFPCFYVGEYAICTYTKLLTMTIIVFSLRLVRVYWYVLEIIFLVDSVCHVPPNALSANLGVSNSVPSNLDQVLVQLANLSLWLFLKF